MRRNMAEMKLYCAVYGEGAVFSVMIARDAVVIALQKAIIDDQRYHGRFLLLPSALTLYLASGEWLKHHHPEKKFSQAGKSADIEKMRLSWKLNKPAYFKDFKLGEEGIYVLVEPPLASVGDINASFLYKRKRWSSTYNTKLQEIETKRARKSIYSLFRCQVERS
nr:crinkler 19 [Plasmopara viticola]